MRSTVSPNNEHWAPPSGWLLYSHKWSTDHWYLSSGINPDTSWIHNYSYLYGFSTLLWHKPNKNTVPYLLSSKQQAGTVCCTCNYYSCSHKIAFLSGVNVTESWTKSEWILISQCRNMCDQVSPSQRVHDIFWNQNFFILLKSPC